MMLTEKQVHAPKEMIATLVYADVVICESKDGKLKGKISKALVPNIVSQGDTIVVSVRPTRTHAAERRAYVKRRDLKRRETSRRRQSPQGCS